MQSCCLCSAACILLLAAAPTASSLPISHLSRTGRPPFPSPAHQQVSSCVRGHSSRHGPACSIQWGTAGGTTLAEHAVNSAAAASFLQRKHSCSAPEKNSFCVPVLAVGVLIFFCNACHLTHVHAWCFATACAAGQDILFKVTSTDKATSSYKTSVVTLLVAPTSGACAGVSGHCKYRGSCCCSASCAWLQSTHMLILTALLDSLPDVWF